MAIKRKEEDVVKQLSTYADGITIFSLGQSIAFTLAVGGQAELARHVQGHRCIVYAVVMFSFFIYVALVAGCHRSENRLTADPKESSIGKAIVTIRRVRFAILALAAALSLFITYSTIPKAAHSGSLTRRCTCSSLAT